VLKRLLNYSEQITYGRLHEVCDRRGARVHAKVRLADVLPIESSGIPDELFGYALQAHFDFVVTNCDHFPLFAVEFDGPLHADTVQNRRDAQKDEVCRRFSLDLHRISSADLCRTERQLDRLTEMIEDWFNKNARQHAGAVVMGPTDHTTLAEDTNMQRKPSCPLCGDNIVEKHGNRGPFLSCVRYPACKGSRDLPGLPRPFGIRAGVPSLGSQGAVTAVVVIAGMIGFAVLVVLLLIRARPEEPRPNSEQPVLMGNTGRGPSAQQGTASSPASTPVVGKRRNTVAEAATIRQMNLLGLLVRRRGWDETQRDLQMEQVLGYKQRYTELSKQEASKLITAWDDRKK
jgi:ssDNA-binding Zn-finger/Zn-ribbon topoisomerase 1